MTHPKVGTIELFYEALELTAERHTSSLSAAPMGPRWSGSPSSRA
jgi:hypothetical protein